MSRSRQELLARKAELTQRLQAIRADIARGLDADSEEQAVQLENMEVLQEIGRLAENELESIEKALAEMPEKD